MKLFHTMLLTGILGATASPVSLAQWQALPETPPIPEDNPQSAAKIKLGKILYFDPRLSSSGTVSCNSCHNVMEGGDDSRPNSVGVDGQTGGRSAPTVWNSAFLSVQFWDGRAPSLEEQAKGPVTNPIEMGMPDWDTVIARLKSIAGYNTLFKEAFGEGNPMTVDNAAKAIASYERTLITPNSPYDRYVKGDEAALTEQQVRGMNTFTEAGCPACHLGANFSGPPMPMGQGFFQKFPSVAGSEYDSKYKLTEDLGRYEVTKKEEDKNMWRVPTLRNVAVTAPYFHHGAVPTLAEAVRVMAKTQLNQELSETQVADIVAFLKGLTGEFPEQTLPRLPAMPGKTVLNSKF